jgi:hypothetical protein
MPIGGREFGAVSSGFVFAGLVRSYPRRAGRSHRAHVRGCAVLCMRPQIASAVCRSASAGCVLGRGRHTVGRRVALRHHAERRDLCVAGCRHCATTKRHCSRRRALSCKLTSRSGPAIPSPSGRRTPTTHTRCSRIHRRARQAFPCSPPFHYHLESERRPNRPWFWARRPQPVFVADALAAAAASAGSVVGPPTV